MPAKVSVKLFYLCKYLFKKVVVFIRNICVANIDKIIILSQTKKMPGLISIFKIEKIFQFHFPTTNITHWHYNPLSLCDVRIVTTVDIMLSHHIILTRGEHSTDTSTKTQSHQRGEPGLMIQFAPADILIVSNTSFSS